MPDIISDQIPMDIPKEHRWPVCLWFHFTSINQLRQTGVFCPCVCTLFDGVYLRFDSGLGTILSSKLGVHIVTHFSGDRRDLTSSSVSLVTFTIQLIQLM